MDERYPPEHFLEVLLKAKDRAAQAHDETQRSVWLTTVRDIETIFADDPPAMAGMRDRLVQRTDPEGRRMYAYMRDLLQTYEGAEREAKQAIGRARRG